jgi:Tetratrico peptide repeat
MMDWDERLAEAWDSLDEVDEQEFLMRIEGLAAELPAGSRAVGDFERASSLDSTGHPDLAVPLYREALEHGLMGERRRRAVIQLASSLRTLGDPRESVALLEAELDEPSDHLDDAVRAFLALALVDTGRPRDAVSLALGALAPHLHRYQRSLSNYALVISDDPPV